MTNKYNPPISFRADLFDKRYMQDIKNFLEDVNPPGTKITQTDVVKYAIYQAFLNVNRKRAKEAKEAQAPN